MNIDIITLYPLFWKNIINNYSIFKKAYIKKKVFIKIYNLRKYGIGNNNKIDDYQYGGGYGMILKIEPIYRCIKELKKKKKYDDIFFLTPNKKIINQKISKITSKKKNILFLCGYFKGIDQRIRDNLITKEYSIGKYILSNGDISTLVFIDTIIRLIPGVIGNIKSAKTDSLYNNNIIKNEYPLYTRPYKYKNMKVPKILLSGNHKIINKWRENKKF
ncbi:MAG: tRNA (guanosine(37)-N1)-methyltransferase TrmD [Candidatus Shikimatogenerans bostrichidophilus]|nr:MAG: tRNA (guanosine(37)-N1)-methyltransferase TrmD [Candidatus Shikimatogenerans bostrichidophilus]